MSRCERLLHGRFDHEYLVVPHMRLHEGLVGRSAVTSYMNASLLSDLLRRHSHIIYGKLGHYRCWAVKWDSCGRKRSLVCRPALRPTQSSDSSRVALVADGPRVLPTSLHVYGQQDRHRQPHHENNEEESKANVASGVCNETYAQWTKER
jgi:hypothetical protein